jgi:hypothetical protein
VDRHRDPVGRGLRVAKADPAHVLAPGIARELATDKIHRYPAPGRVKEGPEAAGRVAFQVRVCYDLLGRYKGPAAEGPTLL